MENGLEARSDDALDVQDYELGLEGLGGLDRVG